MKTEQEIINHCREQVREADHHKHNAYWDGKIAALIGIIHFLDDTGPRDNRQTYLDCMRHNNGKATTALVG